MALVTGASGMLGRALVARLVEGGVGVRAFVRPGSEVAAWEGLPVEVVYGAAGDGPAIERAVAGVALIFHAAGYLATNAPFEPAGGPLPPPYQEVNVDFTGELLRAGREAGVRRFIYASSASVYALDVPVPTPEEARLRPVSQYGRSKLLAEEAIRAGGVPFTIVRPAVIYGPGDRYFTPAALRLARLPLLPLVEGGRTLLDLIYVGDVAALMCRAGQAEAARDRVYNAGPGEPTSLRDLLAAYRAVMGRGPRVVGIGRRRVGQWARWVGPVLRPVLARLAPGSEAVLTEQGVALMTRDMQLEVRRAEVELGFRPAFDLVGGLRATLAGGDWSSL